jgi:hypothetical protein
LGTIKGETVTATIRGGIDWHGFIFYSSYSFFTVQTVAFSGVGETKRYRDKEWSPFVRGIRDKCGGSAAFTLCDLFSYSGRSLRDPDHRSCLVKIRGLTSDQGKYGPDGGGFIVAEWLSHIDDLGIFYPFALVDVLLRRKLHIYEATLNLLYPMQPQKQIFLVIPLLLSLICILFLKIFSYLVIFT